MMGSITADKIAKPSHAVQHKAKQGVFFRKIGEQGFFSKSSESSFFHPGFVQPKLSVSQPGDPYEQEADQVAENVMRMPEPLIPQNSNNNKEEKLQYKKEEEDQEEVVSPKLDTSCPLVVNKKEDDEKKDEIERSDLMVNPKGELVLRSLEESKTEEKIQNKFISPIQRREEESSDSIAEEGEPEAERMISGNYFSTSSENIQRAGRGPPYSSPPIEQQLLSSKGSGYPIPEDTRVFMEERFQSDFSSVRIHTDSDAQHLSSAMHAHAFTHGGDIYFNSGKYNTNSAEGKLLLAHELTHTIQQGASQPAKSNSFQNANIISRKIQRFNSLKNSDSIQCHADIPHMNNFAVLAKSSEVKVNAEQEDDNKKSWDDLLTESFGKSIDPVNEKSETFSVIHKKTSNIKRKDESENIEEVAETDENQAMTKSDLNGSSNIKDHIQSGNNYASKAPPNKIQTKEKEEEEEEKKQNPNVQLYVQAKEVVITQTIHEYSDIGSRNSQIQHSQYRSDYPADLSAVSNFSIGSFDESINKNRGPPINKTPVSGAIEIQRDIIDDALSYINSISECITIDLNEAKRCALRKAQQAALHIPGYRALRVVLGEDPITSEHIERNGRNFIEAAFDIMPGGILLHQKLEEQNQLDAAAAWIDGKIADVEKLVSGLLSSIQHFWNGLGVSDFTSPLDVLRRGISIVYGFINNIVDFAVNAAKELLKIIKEFLLGKIVEFIKEKTTAYPLLTVILGKDPITEERVERNGTNILNAILELGGEEGRMQRDQMRDTGTLQKAAAYIDEGIAVFGNLYETIVRGFKNIWDYVSINSLMEPLQTFERIYNEFVSPISRVLDFVSRVIAEILKLVKDVLFRRISAEAKKVRGYFLITVIINKDPFTGEVVPRTIENIIHGFMSLMAGGDEQFQQMKESGAIDKTTARIYAAVDRLNMTPRSIIQLFIDLWNSFTFRDFLHPVETFGRIIARFGEPVARLLAFVLEIVKIVVETILTIMNFPLDLIGNIIANAMKAFELIKRDPIGFLKNLLKAIKQGFTQFFDNIIQHLLNGLVGWLTSELKDAGVPELNDLSLGGIISWVLEILGISMEKIWEKLAQHPKIGPAKVAKIRSMIDKLTGIWTFIKDVQERGIVAIWDKIKEQLSNLWNVILDAVKNWIMQKIITNVVTKLLSMLDPTGIMAVINSVIALYNAIQSFIKYLREMLEIVNSFVGGVAEVASGVISRAASFLENSLARGIPIVIGFLANQVGLSGIGRRIGEMIGRAREMVDSALTWLVNKAVAVAFNVIDRITGRSKQDEPESQTETSGIFERQVSFGGENHRIKIRTEGDLEFLMASNGFVELHSELTQLRRVYIEPNEQGQGGHLAKKNEEEAKLALDNKLKEIFQKKKEIIAAANKERRGSREQDDILNQGIDDLTEMVEEMSHYMLDTFNIAFGGATDIAVNDIIYVNALEMGCKVIRVREIKDGHFGLFAESLDRTNQVFLNYEDHDFKWKKAPTNAPPFYAGFTGTEGTGTRMSVNVQTDSPEGGDPNHDPPGYGATYNRRGHLVAKMFGGPGTKNNIVAMTYNTNQTNTGMVSIETDTRKEIQKGTVITYKATPDYGGKKWQIDPPVGINVVVDEVWPNPKNAILSKYVNNI